MGPLHAFFRCLPPLFRQKFFRRYAAPRGGLAGHRCRQLSAAGPLAPTGKLWSWGGRHGTSVCKRFSPVREKIIIHRAPDRRLHRPNVCSRGHPCRIRSHIVNACARRSGSRSARTACLAASSGRAFPTWRRTRRAPLGAPWTRPLKSACTRFSNRYATSCKTKRGRSRHCILKQPRC